MDSFGTRMQAAVSLVCERLCEADASTRVAELNDAELLAGFSEVASARKLLDLVEAAYAAEAERRSAREFGAAGLSHKTGHRTGTALIQHITGRSAGDVRRTASVGKDLAADGVPVTSGPEVPGAARVEVEPWFAPLTAALRTGAIAREQFDAIRRGLGEPPADRYPDTESEFWNAAWQSAAVVLLVEAADATVEDLAQSARLARDTLDPVGVQLRFDERYARRSLRMWIDEHGQQHAKLVFDDDGAAWVRTILNAALRPRRGPRFAPARGAAGLDADAAGAEEVDERSNEQLQYDTILAVMRTGAAADPRQAFGDRQPGVRVVVPVESVSGVGGGAGATGSADAGVGYFEETGQPIPIGVVETYLCDAGSRAVTVDSCGNPLDVGREKRLFTKKQRVALALRDGGCLWCGSEPSRCEAHHIDHWYEHHGRTDLADGVLLCRSCHLRLHNGRWRIVRTGREYELHAPPGSGVMARKLRARSLLRFRDTG